MREDLIERLRREAAIRARAGQLSRLNALADEFAVALESSAPVGVPVDVVREYLDARACYEAATRRPNSHAPAPVLKHGDPVVLRLHEARVALDNAIVLAQQPPSAPVGMEAAVERLKDRTFPKHECPAESAAVWNTALYEMQRVLAQQPAADGYCVTREDGECVSSDLRCMHNKPAAVDEATRRDAERYRWLRGLDGSCDSAACVNFNIGFDWIEAHGVELDDAIDAAMNGANT